MKYLLPLLLSLSLPAQSFAFSVSPIRNHVKVGGAATVRVDNAGSETPLTFEATVKKRIIGEEGMTGTEDAEDDFVIIPPTGIIPAGSSQALRVQYVGEEGDTVSQHYFFNVREIPVDIEDDTEAPVQGVRARINIAFAYNVAINVSPPAGKAELALVSVTGGKTKEIKKDDQTLSVPAVELIIENNGADYAYLDNHTLHLTDVAGKKITLEGDALLAIGSTPLIPGNSTRRFLLTMEDHMMPEGAVDAELF